MTTNYTSCPKCGKTMISPSMYVPPVTWNGQIVCTSCTIKIQKEVPNDELDKDKNQK